MEQRHRSAFRRAWPYGVASVALAGVFALYTRPRFLVVLADQLWSCF
jgi:hypothetical protein